ncbi:DUF7079 family protein, partial [Listeria monocytogenes]|uniref:DUF7079 family protein n=1 Tax=Listeria monocytogenes TaxID=1639 RepID=UPI003FA4B8F4
TEVTETDFANIASSLAGTSFSVDEIISIMENEVAPVLHGNLLLVAGQWGCFDREAQVVEPIRARLMRLTDPRNNGWPPFALMRRKFHMM